MRKIAAHYIVTFQGEAIKNGIVQINDSGVIQNISKATEKLQEQRTLEFYSGVIIPDILVPCKSFHQLVSKGEAEIPSHQVAKRVQQIGAVLRSQSCAALYCADNTYRNQLLNDCTQLKSFTIDDVAGNLPDTTQKEWSIVSEGYALTHSKAINLAQQLFSLQAGLSLNLAELLKKLYTLWRNLFTENFSNSLETGKVAGVNLLSNIDYSSMKITPKSTIRRLV